MKADMPVRRSARGSSGSAHKEKVFARRTKRMKRFLNDTKKYYKYAIYSAKSKLQSEVASSYLNWLWWVLDPICFMLIYTVIFGVVFNAKEQYFPVFIFIGLTMWDFFNKTLVQSVKIVKANKSIVSKVYLPKYVLVMVRMFVNGFKMLISFGIVLVMMLIYRVPISLNILYMIPIMLTLFLITFGCSTIVLHFGVFVQDLSNVINIVLRLLFYMTGIFYNVETRLAKFAPWNKILLHCNPMALLLTSARRCMIYDQIPARKFLLLWFLLGIVLSAIGVKIIYKYENSYVKVI